MNCLWKTISADAGYEVSSSGRVRSIERLIPQRASGRAQAGERRMAAREIKPYLAKSTGYLQVSLSGKARHSVHRLVAIAFCEGRLEGLVVNHKNGIRSDNRAENLEWVTHSENVSHGFASLGRTPTGIGKFGAQSPAAKPVIAANIASGVETYFACGMDAKRAGFDSGAISKCCDGRLKTHKGHTWKRSEKRVPA